MLVFLVLRFHSESCPVDVMSWNHSSELLENSDFPSRNYGLESCLHESFLLGSQKFSSFLHMVINTALKCGKTAAGDRQSLTSAWQFHTEQLKYLRIWGCGQQSVPVG